MSYDDHDDHGHHGSWAPILASLGTMLFLYGFAEANLGVAAIGLSVLVWGLFTWWKGDLPFDGSEKMGELKAQGSPFGGMNIRKAGMWLFLMSEVMIFGTFFGAYTRMRSNWNTHWTLRGKAVETVDAGSTHTADEIMHECLPHVGHADPVACEAITTVGNTTFVDSSFWINEAGIPVYHHVAAEYVTHSFMTLLPGAINTFALILSSFTLVLALKAAKNIDLDDKVRNRKVRNYLSMTFFLGALFIVLKLVEWNHLIHEDFTIATLAGSFFYVTTGAHGVHVFVGLVFITYFIYKAHTGGWDPNNAQSIEYYGLYWHFVDLAWVLIFPAFYLY